MHLYKISNSSSTIGLTSSINTNEHVLESNIWCHGLMICSNVKNEHIACLISFSSWGCWIPFKSRVVLWNNSSFDCVIWVSCDLHHIQFEKMLHERRMQKLCTITNKDEKKLFKTFYKVWGTRKFNHKEG